LNCPGKIADDDPLRRHCAHCAHCAAIAHLFGFTSVDFGSVAFAPVCFRFSLIDAPADSVLRMYGDRSS